MKEDGEQKADDRGQRSDDRGQKADIGIRNDKAQGREGMGYVFFRLPTGA